MRRASDKPTTPFGLSIGWARARYCWGFLAGAEASEPLLP